MDFEMVVNRDDDGGVEWFSDEVSAGFPSPAEGYMEKKLSLDEHLVKHPAATFFVRVGGDSMSGIGINQGDILIVDKSLNARNGDVVVANLDGEFTVKRFKKDASGVFLVPENREYPTIKVDVESDFMIWGVVSSFIHTFRTS